MQSRLLTVLLLPFVFTLSACGDDDQDCTPSCSGKECGPDSCGSTCGPGCGGGETCNGGTGQCESCQPDCDGKECGPDACGGFCDPGCDGTDTCNEDTGQCECVPDCDGKECGPDGCGDTCGPGCGVIEECNQETGRCISLELLFEAGYQEIEPVTFTLRLEQDEQTYHSSAARLWYAFQLADETPEDKPLAVMFNGGPGASTSSLLFAFNTAKKTLDARFNGGVEVGDNPASWTRFANLLYIDARAGGFSYNLMTDPSDTEARQAEFNVHNFNAFLDAADFVRVILRFLASHPAIQDNPVVIVGESYGGLRSTLILHLLINYLDYADDQGAYQDTALADEIQAHFEDLYPEYQGQVVPREVIADQFSRQVMIQPLISGGYEGPTKGEMWEQPGSVIFQIGQEAGLTYVPCSEIGGECNPVGNALTFVYEQCGRDPYNYAQVADWTTDTADGISTSMLVVDNLNQATGFDVTSIDWLMPGERIGAYRIGDLALLEFVIDQGDFPDAFGELPEWDAYHIFLNEYVWHAFHSDDIYRFEINNGNIFFGEKFLDNATLIDIFLTDAPYDLRVFSAAQPTALARYEDILAGTEHDTDPRPGVDRPGWMHLDYLDSSGIGRRTIRFPRYQQSGHVVELDQPVELRDDLLDWLAETKRY